MPEGARISRIEPWLARGGQPEARDYTKLYDSGIRIIVNLRLHHDDARDVEKYAPGLLCARIPVKNDHAPSDEQGTKWLTLCDSIRDSLPIYVHCHEGHGRTSVFCALVRIAQGYDLETIIAEERTYGFDPEKQKEQTAFIRRYYDEFKTGRKQIPRLSQPS